MTARIGRERVPEQLALASLLVQIGRLARPAERRSFLAAVTDTYGAAVPERRARVLAALLAEAEAVEARARRRSARSEFAAWVPVVRRR